MLAHIRVESQRLDVISDEGWCWLAELCTRHILTSWNVFILQIYFHPAAWHSFLLSHRQRERHRNKEAGDGGYDQRPVYAEWRNKHTHRGRQNHREHACADQHDAGDQAKRVYEPARGDGHDAG